MSINNAGTQISTIRAFKTSDGTIFESNTEALEHEILLVANRKLIELVEDNLDVSSSIVRDDVANFLISYRNRIFEILKPCIEIENKNSRSK